MARPMNPLPTAGPLAAFAGELRALRRRAGQPPLHAMSLRCGLSPASLSKAQSGVHHPTWDTVSGYVTACDVSPDLWRARWQSLRLATESAAPGKGSAGEALHRWMRTGHILPPESVPDLDTLRSLLRAVLEYQGLSLRALAKQSPGYSHNSYGAMLRGTRPLTPRIFKEFLLGSGVRSMSSLTAWFLALARLQPERALEAAEILHALKQRAQQNTMAGDRDMKMLRETLQALEEARKQVATARSYSSLREAADDLRTAIGDMLSGLQLVMRSQPPRIHSISRVRMTALTQGVVLPDPSFLDAFVPAALPYQSAMQDSVIRALLSSARLVVKAEARLSSGVPTTFEPR